MVLGYHQLPSTRVRLHPAPPPHPPCVNSTRLPAVCLSPSFHEHGSEVCPPYLLQTLVHHVQISCNIFAAWPQASRTLHDPPPPSLATPPAPAAPHAPAPTARGASPPGTRCGTGWTAAGSAPWTHPGTAAEERVNKEYAVVGGCQPFTPEASSPLGTCCLKA